MIAKRNLLLLLRFRLCSCCCVISFSVLLPAPPHSNVRRNWLNCRRLRCCFAVAVVVSLSVHFIGPKYVQITFSFSYHCSVQTHLFCVGLFTCCWSVLGAFFVNKTFRSCLSFFLHDLHLSLVFIIFLFSFESDQFFLLDPTWSIFILCIVIIYWKECSSWG